MNKKIKNKSTYSRVRLTTTDFISKAKSIHGDKYDYSLIDYKLTAIPVNIICKKHGVFEQIPNSHLSGNGCRKCKYENHYKNRINNHLIALGKIQQPIEYKLLPIQSTEFTCMVDNDIFESIKNIPLHLSTHGYVLYKGRKYLHRLVSKCRDGFMIDHINMNKLDNRLCNLRECVNSENQRNKPGLPGSSSIYKGVSLTANKKRWRARIILQKVHYYLGTFDDEKEAAIAYNKKALELFGEFAWLNKID